MNLFFAPHLDQIMYIDPRAALFLHGNGDVVYPSTLNTNSLKFLLMNPYNL